MTDATVSDVAEELGRASRDTRRASTGTWLALAGLTIIASGAVVAGMLANNAEIWTAAGLIFYLAMAVLIGFAANKLGAVSATAEILRARLGAGKSSRDGTASPQPGEAPPDLGSAALALAHSLEADGQLAKAEYAYQMAVEQNDSPEALYWLGHQCLKRRDYKTAELWLLRAADSGVAAAAYLLGGLHRISGQRIDNATYESRAGSERAVAAYVAGRNEALPDSRILAQFSIDPAIGKSAILRNLAVALPDSIEVWQAYFASVLEADGRKSARRAVRNAIEEYPDNANFKLLQIRLEPSLANELFLRHFPEPMHSELHFHTALNLINKYDEPAGFSESKFRKAISEAGTRTGIPALHSQLLAIEAAYEYITMDDAAAGKLLESALALKPRLAGPLSSDDVKLLALALRSRGDPAIRSLSWDLAHAQPGLEGALYSTPDSRKPVFKALLSSAAPGIDISAPIPGARPFDAADIPESLDTSEPAPP